MTLKNMKFLLDIRELGSFVKLELVAPGSCEVSILGDVKNPTEHNPGQPALVGLLSAGGLDWAVSRDVFQPQLLCHPVNYVVVETTLYRLCTRLVSHWHKQHIHIGVLLSKRHQIKRTM